MTTIDSRFAGRTAIVTGAASGIGRATALRLAAEGATVIACDVTADGLTKLVEENPGAALVSVPGDITADGVPEAIVAAANGPVDILVNNAGIMDAFLPAAEVDDATWDRVFAVNVKAQMRLIRAVLPGMLEAGKGAIVNLASEAGLRGSAAGVAYTASKHAVIGLTVNTAVMYGKQGVRCNAVAPGAVATNIEAPMKSQHAAGVVGPLMQVVLPGIAQPEELAAAITWLASDDAANVNGIVLPCDRGWSAI
jgi:NAD(P)-dependent dehydrogenase (short-subunit alcohol dehydrogenase family)